MLLVCQNRAKIISTFTDASFGLNFAFFSMKKIAKFSTREKKAAQKLRGERTAKWLPWTTSNHHILGSLTSLGLNFCHGCSIKGRFNVQES